MPRAARIIAGISILAGIVLALYGFDLLLNDGDRRDDPALRAARGSGLLAAGWSAIIAGAFFAIMAEVLDRLRGIESRLATPSTARPASNLDTLKEWH